MNTPLLARIAARRSSAQQGPAPVAVPAGTGDPQSEPTSRAPFVPEWRRRATARVAQSGYVAVLDTTSLS